MARFVSKSGAYRVIAQGDDYMVLANGKRQQIQKALVADFNHDTLTPEEIQVGVTDFRHRGLPEEPGTEQELSPLPRISGFDTVEAQRVNGWTDEEREIVESALRNHPALGIEFKELTPEPTKVPFPTYDKVDADKLVALAVATGTVEQAIAYERENLNREDVVDALEAALEDADAPVVIEA